MEKKLGNSPVPTQDLSSTSASETSLSGASLSAANPGGSVTSGNDPGCITIPVNDKQRVEALRRYRIAGTPPEKTFDNISNLAARLFDLPVALINFVDMEEVFVKTTTDLKGVVMANPRGSSLCSLAMLSKDVTVFETLPVANPCLLSNSIVAAELGFKFYAGAPLITPDGFNIGTVCVMGYEKRTCSEKEKEMLQNIAKIVMDEIELRLEGIHEIERQATEFVDDRKRLEFIAISHIEILASHNDLALQHKNLRDTLFLLPQIKPELYNVITLIENNLEKVEKALRLVATTAKS